MARSTILGSLERAGWLLVLMPALASTASAETLPPSIRACLAEPDASLRLNCYDRAAARLIAPPDTFTPAAPSAAAPSPAAPPVTAAPAREVAAPAGPAAAAVAPSAAKAAAAAAKHQTAKVASARGPEDSLVITLDNGAVWEQTLPGTAALHLRPGDVVQVDKELGGWFLTDRYGNTLQVRPKAPAP